jgi:hypothetical protein
LGKRRGEVGGGLDLELVWHCGGGGGGNQWLPRRSWMRELGGATFIGGDGMHASKLCFREAGQCPKFVLPPFTITSHFGFSQSQKIAKVQPNIYEKSQRLQGKIYSIRILIKYIFKFMHFVFITSYIFS